MEDLEQHVKDAIANGRYEMTERGILVLLPDFQENVKYAAQKRYFQTPKGCVARNKAARQYRERNKMLIQKKDKTEVRRKQKRDSYQKRKKLTVDELEIC
ncbi:hypothetical protein [Chroococcus sp. FPU101]|uniref:hypothetical protein n=1 Tax=Chroococcus sp. FPU101 TaxID=1974212 RepID=UPI001A9082CE|nr:hypothetical protein [Chroococcus sp. FPU101]GFE69036.1 hypothetical protein CFPU101_16460 [Chroococcus sp. FPU101]